MKTSQTTKSGILYQQRRVDCPVNCVDNHEKKYRKMILFIFQWLINEDFWKTGCSVSKLVPVTTHVTQAVKTKHDQMRCPRRFRSAQKLCSHSKLRWQLLLCLSFSKSMEQWHSECQNRKTKIKNELAWTFSLERRGKITGHSSLKGLRDFGTF